MNIKQKLFIMQIIMVFILLIPVGLMIRNFFDVRRQVNILDQSITQMSQLVRISLNIGLQTKEIMEYMADDGNYKKDIEDLKKDFDKSVTILYESLSNDIRVNATNVYSEADDLRKIEKNYNEFLKIVDRVIFLKNSGRDDEAFKIINNELEPMVQNLFIKNIEGYLSNEIKKNDILYNKILIDIGILPWVKEQSLFQVNKGKISSLYFLSVEKVFSDLNQLIRNSLRDSLSKGVVQESDNQEFEFRISGNLNEIFEIIKTQKELGEQGEGNDEIRITKVKGKIGKLLIILEDVKNLKIDGETNKQYSHVVNALIPFVHDEIYPLMKDTIDDGSKEIEESHKMLLNIVSLAMYEAVILLTLISSLILLFSYKTITGITKSIGNMTKGAETL